MVSDGFCGSSSDEPVTTATPARPVKSMRRRPRMVLMAMVALLAVVVVGPSSAAVPHLPVYFVQGEQLAGVARQGSSPLDAVQRLIAGPTRAEVSRGFRTYVPSGTRVRSVKVRRGVATVDLNERFASGRDRGSLLARLSQLVRTLTGLQGATKVQLLVNGKVAAARFPGVSTGAPISFGDLQTPNVPVPRPPQPRLPAPDPAVKVVQQRLIELGYLIRGDDDGRFGPATQNAVLAFQKWERLDRTGLVDAKTKSRLVGAKHPVPLSHRGGGKRAEILLDRQVALLINDNRVVRTIAVSSGKPSTPTPAGSYRVYAKIPRWWSTPFREWLPWALPFVGGIAFHEFPDVPIYPASHGCVRQALSVARWTYNFATVGMPVRVIGKS
jgi:Sporulation and spore germination/L,D-transpeptidase catalytic domain/Putative peptidoglycan binding domain